MWIRPAARADLEAMVGAGDGAGRDPGREAVLRDAIDAGHALVATDAGSVLGYAVLDHSFYGHAFLALLAVRASSRRRGVGTALLRAAEARARTRKIFTSTNESNAPMRALLEREGYERSGVIENLDPGEPELVYVRFLDEDAA